MASAFADPGAGVAFGPVDGLDHVPGPPGVHLRPGPAPIENWAYAHGASMAIRVAAAREVGGFDERLGPGTGTHGEEADIVVRLAAGGWTARIADAPVVTHLEWRDESQSRANLLVYERGAGAWLGAGMRRDPRRVAKVLVLRLRYQAELWGNRRTRGWSFGPRTTAAFLGGFARGLTYRPRRWL
jgi:GT2 family glycosyltransferase